MRNNLHNITKFLLTGKRKRSYVIDDSWAHVKKDTPMTFAFSR